MLFIIKGFDVRLNVYIWLIQYSLIQFEQDSHNSQFPHQYLEKHIIEIGHSSILPAPFHTIVELDAQHIYKVIETPSSIRPHRSLAQHYTQSLSHEHKFKQITIKKQRKSLRPHFRTICKHILIMICPIKIQFNCIRQSAIHAQIHIDSNTSFYFNPQTLISVYLAFTTNILKHIYGTLATHHTSATKSCVRMQIADSYLRLHRYNNVNDTGTNTDNTAIPTWPSRAFHACAFYPSIMSQLVSIRLNRSVNKLVSHLSLPLHTGVLVVLFIDFRRRRCPSHHQAATLHRPARVFFWNYLSPCLF